MGANMHIRRKEKNWRRRLKKDDFHELFELGKKLNENTPARCALPRNEDPPRDQNAAQQSVEWVAALTAACSI